MRRKQLTPLEWLDALKRRNPAVYQEAVDLVTEGLITFDSDGRMRGADGRVFTLVKPDGS